jgi:hypothetical protein
MPIVSDDVLKLSQPAVIVNKNAIKLENISNLIAILLVIGIRKTTVNMKISRFCYDMHFRTSCMPIVSDDVLKLSQPAVIVLFAPMLMHLLQYILFLSLLYVNHVYKLAQRN